MWKYHYLISEVLQSARLHIQTFIFCDEYPVVKIHPCILHAQLIFIVKFHHRLQGLALHDAISGSYLKPDIVKKLRGQTLRVTVAPPKFRKLNLGPIEWNPIGNGLRQ